MFRSTRPSSQSYQVAAVCGMPLGITDATTAMFGWARNWLIAAGMGLADMAEIYLCPTTVSVRGRVESASIPDSVMSSVSM